MEMSYYSTDISGGLLGPVTPSTGTKNFSLTILNLSANKQKRQKGNME